MTTFEKNIQNTWGQKGEAWLMQLPAIVQALCDHWSLHQIEPVINMTYNYVARAQQGAKSIVLKISFDEKLIQDEYNALQHFNGCGAIQAIDIHETHHALLLEQAVPGLSLKVQRGPEDVSIYASVVKRLLNNKEPIDNTKQHVSQWCQAIDRIDTTVIERGLFEQAKSRREKLLSTMTEPVFCHGDLHLDNILQQGDHWLAIDPKGIIGEVAFEAAAFDLINPNLSTVSPSTIEKTIHALSQALSVDYTRLLDWFFLRTMISVQWFIEDNGDPSDAISRASMLYQLTK